MTAVPAITATNAAFRLAVNNLVDAAEQMLRRSETVPVAFASEQRKLQHAIERVKALTPAGLQNSDVTC